MILDHVQRLEQYRQMFVGIGSLTGLVEEMREQPPGRYQVRGCTVLIQQGQTKPVAQGVFEAHRRMIDLQILLRGQEVLEWSPLTALTPAEPYQENSDLALYTGAGVQMQLEEGAFYILLPSDGHKACCHVDVPHDYHKMVVKIPVEGLA